MASWAARAAVKAAGAFIAICRVSRPHAARRNKPTALMGPRAASVGSYCRWKIRSAITSATTSWPRSFQCVSSR